MRQQISVLFGMLVICIASCPAVMWIIELMNRGIEKNTGLHAMCKPCSLDLSSCLLIHLLNPAGGGVPRSPFFRKNRL